MYSQTSVYAPRASLQDAQRAGQGGYADEYTVADLVS